MVNASFLPWGRMVTKPSDLEPQKVSELISNVRLPGCGLVTLRLHEQYKYN